MKQVSAESEHAISKILTVQGVSMLLAFFLVSYVPVGWIPIFSLGPVFYALLRLSLLCLFIYPLFQGYEIRKDRVRDYTDINYWFRFSLIGGPLYILSAFLTTSSNWILLSLPALVYLIPGMIWESPLLEESPW